MNLPLQITYREMEANETLSSEISKRAAALERYFDRVTRCRVIVAAPSQHHRHGQHHVVRIELSVPGHEIISGEHDGNEDVFVAMRSSFATAERELKKYAERRVEHQHSRFAAVQ